MKAGCSLINALFICYFISIYLFTSSFLVLKTYCCASNKVEVLVGKKVVYRSAFGTVAVPLGERFWFCSERAFLPSEALSDKKKNHLFSFKLLLANVIQSGFVNVTGGVQKEGPPY